MDRAGLSELGGGPRAGGPPGRPLKPASAPGYSEVRPLSLDSRHMRLRVGTSGFSYPGWRGALYPAKAKPADFLSLYASHFDTVELNATFYRMPTRALLEGLAAKVGDDFVFAVKATQTITHVRRLRDCEGTVRELFEVLGALGAHLGPVLFQLPPNAKFDRARLEAFLPLLAGSPAPAFEFRHPSFFEPEALEILRRSPASLVISDETEPLDVVLARAKREAPSLAVSYVRLRRESYDERDLGELVERLREFGRDAYVYVKHEVSGPALADRVRKLWG